MDTPRSPPAQADIGLDAVWRRAVRSLGWPDAKRLLDAGAPPAVLAHGHAGYLDIRVLDGGGWEPDPDGIPALIFPAEAHGDLIDLVAEPALGGGLEPMLGRAWAIGDPFTGAPVKVVRSTAAWLRSPHDSLLIIDPAAAWWRLRSVPALAAEDVDHGRELAQLMAPPPWAGRVLVPRRAGRRGAA